MENLSTYTIKDKIADSRWTTLFTAVHKVNGSKVIVKFFNLKGSLSDAIGTEKEVIWRKRFALETRIMERANHPNIVPLLAHGKIPDGRPCLIMPFIDANLRYEIGPDITDPRVLARLAPPRRPKPHPPDRVYAVLRQMLAGLDHLHNLGIVHRDLKPSNVLVTRRSGDQVLVCDFGMAKWQGEVFDVPGEMIGSRGYVSPEQKTDASTVDASADIYSVGLMAFRMLTGYLPIDSEVSVLARNSCIAVPVDRLIQTCLSATPSDRPHNAGVMLSELDAALKDGS